MLISEISIKGFKSYGNNEQTLKLNTEKGELILLVGNNGSGKSSLLDSFDFTLYGKVRGRKKKWATLSTLPNRINGELLNKIKFISNGVNVEIRRGISPNILELIENGVLYDRAGKVNIEERIEKYVGMDIETFKSFISMSINDFKNFISLSNEEKQLLLDKLFNLEVINILNNIVKELNKNNKLKIASLESEIKTLEESILSIKKSIEKAIEKEKEEIKKALEKEKENIQNEIQRLLNEMNDKKDDYIKLKEKIEKIKNKENELNIEIENEKKQYLSIQNEIKNVQKEIELYEMGKCPMCKTDLTLLNNFLDIKNSFINKKNSLEEIKKEIENNIKSIKEKQDKIKILYEKTTAAFNDVVYLIKNYKSQIETLKQKISSDENLELKIKTTSNIEEFNKSIKELEEKIKISSDNISICKNKEIYYKELSKLFSEEGIKRTIISNIINPINYFVSENIKKMGLQFEVKLNENFNAEIKHLGNIIEHDSLSTGETKKINIAILIAYLKLIRTKKHINILFLDEVFSSIDIEGIDSILTLLKSFANEYNINIFVVHHAILNQDVFDRIIRINKDIFSYIEEIK